MDLKRESKNRTTLGKIMVFSNSAGSFGSPCGKNETDHYITAKSVLWFFFFFFLN